MLALRTVGVERLLQVFPLVFGKGCLRLAVPADQDIMDRAVKLRRQDAVRQWDKVVWSRCDCRRFHVHRSFLDGAIPAMQDDFAMLRSPSAVPAAATAVLTHVRFHGAVPCGLLFRVSLLFLLPVFLQLVFLLIRIESHGLELGYGCCIEFWHLTHPLRAADTNKPVVRIAG